MLFHKKMLLKYELHEIFLSKTKRNMNSAKFDPVIS